MLPLVQKANREREAIPLAVSAFNDRQKVQLATKQ
jgi:hypothetical protein